MLTAFEDGHDRAADPMLLDRATAVGRVLSTRDEDFLALASRRQSDGIPFAGVVYVHQMGPTIGQCVHDLERVANEHRLPDLAGRVIYLPRSG